MKHSLIITAIILGMFVLTQFIGIFVVQQYMPEKILINGTLQTISPILPYGMQPPETPPQYSLISIIFAFAIALALLLFLSRLHAVWILRTWFFVVITLALGLAFTAFFLWYNSFSNNFIASPSTVAIVLAIPLAYLKIFKRNIFIHNFTELLIYPGIAAIFIPLLNIWTIIILLMLISLYDMYAVWHSGFMQKMAKYQMEHLKIFSGFFIPYLSKKQRTSINLLSKSQKQKKKIKVHVALLGGGDVVFPIIASGIVLIAWGLIPALLVSLGATLGLTYLLFFAEKGKFYPAMPYISVGIFLGMLVGYLIRVIF